MIAVVLSLVPALVPAAPASAGTAAERPNPADLEAELVCPTCKTTLDQSDAPVARRMKAFIRARIADGAGEAEIKAELVDQFGPAVLATPPRKGFDLLAWTWSTRRESEARPDGRPLDPELERRLDEELARFEG